MDPTALAWSRLQFAITNMFHYLYPPLSIGLGLFLVVVGGLSLWTKNPVWGQLSRFWTKVFALTFAIGVATGIPMEFQFGTNWSIYSRYVGDVFGSALAAEGIFAFFLESGFLAVVLFGAGRLSPKTQYFGTVMVSLGAHFSAIWIVIAGSWMHTPAGYHLVMGPGGMRAEIVDFWAMVFNPSAMTRLTHVLMGAWIDGAFLVLSVAAWYLLQRKHEAFAKASFKAALPLMAGITLLQLVASGHHSAELVARHQPVKFAAMEGHWEADAPADLVLFGRVDSMNEVTRGVKLPGATSWLLHGDRTAPVPGLKSVPPEDRPPVNLTFQSYHLMIAIGISLILLSFVGCWKMLRGTLWTSRPMLWLFVFAVLGPVIANEVGWMTAEVGRQPWIVQGLLRTRDAVSPLLKGGQVMRSTGLFTFIYLLLFTVFIYVLNDKIQTGPDSEIDRRPMAKESERWFDLFLRPRAKR